MTGMAIGDFIDKVYCGDELEFIIGKTTYFVQGYQEDNKFVLTVDYWNKTDGTESTCFRLSVMPLKKDYHVLKKQPYSTVKPFLK